MVPIDYSHDSDTCVLHFFKPTPPAKPRAQKIRYCDLPSFFRFLELSLLLCLLSLWDVGLPFSHSPSRLWPISVIYRSCDSIVFCFQEVAFLSSRIACDHSGAGPPSSATGRWGAPRVSPPPPPPEPGPRPPCAPQPGPPLLTTS